MKTDSQKIQFWEYRRQAFIVTVMSEQYEEFYYRSRNYKEKSKLNSRTEK